jgi:hypothetical protein
MDPNFNPTSTTADPLAGITFSSTQKTSYPESEVLFFCGNLALSLVLIKESVYI